MPAYIPGPVFEAIVCTSHPHCRRSAVIGYVACIPRTRMQSRHTTKCRCMVHKVPVKRGNSFCKRCRKRHLQAPLHAASSSSCRQIWQGNAGACLCFSAFQCRDYKVMAWPPIPRRCATKVNPKRHIRLHGMRIVKRRHAATVWPPSPYKQKKHQQRKKPRRRIYKRHVEFQRSCANAFRHQRNGRGACGRVSF